MIEVGSYCCSLVETPFPSSKTKASWSAARFRFLGLVVSRQVVEILGDIVPECGLCDRGQ